MAITVRDIVEACHDDVMSFEDVTRQVTFTDSTRQINHRIKTRFAFEAKRHASLAAVAPDVVAANPSP